jgi:hypothetical protein
LKELLNQAQDIETRLNRAENELKELKENMVKDIDNGN